MSFVLSTLGHEHTRVSVCGKLWREGHRSEREQERWTTVDTFTVSPSPTPSHTPSFSSYLKQTQRHSPKLKISIYFSLYLSLRHTHKKTYTFVWVKERERETYLLTETLPSHATYIFLTYIPLEQARLIIGRYTHNPITITLTRTAYELPCHTNTEWERERCLHDSWWENVNFEWRSEMWSY